MPSRPRRKLGGDVARAGRGHDARRRGAGRGADRGRRQGAASRTRRISRRPTAENVAATALSLLPGGYTHVLAPATGFGKNVMPRVAALLDVAQVSEIIGHRVAGHLRAPDLRGQRARHRAVEGRDQGDHRAHHGIRRAPAPAASAPVESDRGRARHRPVDGRGAGAHEVRAARAHQRAHRRLGRPRLGSGENFKMLEPLADKLNAAIGASRAAVDAGFVPND